MELLKPEQLRVGNVLTDPNGKTDRVAAIAGGNLHLHFYGNCDYVDAAPIPITEEWLVRMGFVNDFSDLSLIIAPTIEFCYSEGNMYLMVGQFSEMSTTVPCDYVHQFQNLFFALKSEELTIKIKCIFRGTPMTKPYKF